MEEPFREICEEQTIINNLSFEVKLLRVSIRYIVRFFGLIKSIKLIEKLYRFSSKLIFGEKSFYANYLLRINHFRLLSLKEISNDNFEGVLRIKADWARYVCEHSFSRFERFNARSYLRLVNDHSTLDQSINITNEIPIGHKDKKKKIYIYGPNAQEPPKEKYRDFSLVLLKPYDGDLQYFKETFLFLNSFYYNNVVIKESLETQLIDNYDKCYVSCRQSNLPKGFLRPKFPSQGFLGSSMALGRVLFHFIREFGELECVIEGFDLYLSKNPYKNEKYHKLSRQEDGSIEEIDFTMSLAEHDYIYNFFFIQKMMSKVFLNDSQEFSEIIKMHWRDYCKQLHESRNFKTLRNI